MWAKIGSLLLIIVIGRINEDDLYYVQGRSATTEVETSCLSERERATLFNEQLLLLSFAFHDLKFCLSSQLKAASCARCSSEMPPSKQVNGHSFSTCLIVWGSPQSQSGEAM